MAFDDFWKLFGAIYTKRARNITPNVGKSRSRTWWDTGLPCVPDVEVVLDGRHDL